MTSSQQDHFLLVGAGGREASFALKLAEDSRVSAFVSHNNPTILECVTTTGGKTHVGDVCDPDAVTGFALLSKANYAFVNADEPLAHGIVDKLTDAGIRTIGATRAASRIEWDKIHAMLLMQSVSPECTPRYEIVKTPDDITPALDTFQELGLDIVVKPQGLTGGKGVKVMPEHLSDYQACADYTAELLSSRPGEKVLLVEKLTGIEFTIMGITDGDNLVMSPASYDYPFRYENDTGPGTGGMGCFTAAEKKLPFLTDNDIQQCREIMHAIIRRLAESGTPFSGVLNGGFFKTVKGIRFMEFNSRFGDPEGLNILAILQQPFSGVLRAIWSRTLTDIDFIPEASVIKYLVAPEYPCKSPSATRFKLDITGLRSLDLNLFFGACEQIDSHTFQTLGSSRVLAIGATASDIAEASERINQGIDQFVRGQLEYRRDIGSREDVDRLISIALPWNTNPENT